MKVLFFRETSASNSSDDHRIVLLKSKSNCIEPEYLWHYNREDFFLASKKQKQRYLQVILGQAFHQLFKEVDMPTVVARYKKFYEENNFKEILGRAHVNKGNCAHAFDLVGEIGHQSSLPPVYDFCKTGIFYGEKYLCVEFYKEMFKDILRDNVAIEGGTDDCDERTEHNCVDYNKPYRMYYNWLRRCHNCYNARVYARKDSSGVWILTSKNNGVFLLRFDDKPMEPLQIPYLVDLNVTEWCNYNCSFCYRGCNEKGKTVDPKLCSKIIANLTSSGVAELVLGSGNTAHLFRDDKKYRSLRDYTNSFRGSNDTYSVSTTLNWQSFLDLYLDVNLLAFIQPLDSLAVSITDAPAYTWEQLKKLADFVVRHAKWNFKVKFQFIPEMLEPAAREKLMKAFQYEPLCLLGYKSTGRGKDLIPLGLGDDFWQLLKNYNTFYLTVDATFAETYKDKLVAFNGENEIRTCKQEGICSCFLDPLRNRLYENSHSEKYVDFDAQKFAELPIDKAITYLKQQFAELQEKK